MMEPEQTARFERESRALGRAAAHDAKALAQGFILLEQFEHELNLAAAELLAQGYSYAELGAELGISRQAAHKRFSLYAHPTIPA